MEETLKLEVFVENNGIYSTLYPSRALLEEKEKKNRTFEYNEKKEIILSDSFWCNINENQFKNNKCDIKVNIDHNNNYWKNGWLIDALVLEQLK